MTEDREPEDRKVKDERRDVSPQEWRRQYEHELGSAIFICPVCETVIEGDNPCPRRGLKQHRYQTDATRPTTGGSVTEDQEPATEDRDDLDISDESLVAFVAWCRLNPAEFVQNPMTARRVLNAYRQRRPQ